MTEAVQLALIAGFFAFWHDLINNAGAVGAALMALLTFLYQVWTRREASEGRKHIVTALQNNDAKTDMVAAAMGVDTTKPAGLNPDLTQPVKV
jgi:hypothetical protein